MTNNDFDGTLDANERIARGRCLCSRGGYPLFCNCARGRKAQSADRIERFKTRRVFSGGRFENRGNLHPRP